MGQVLIELCRIEISSVKTDEVDRMVLIELCRIEIIGQKDSVECVYCFNRTL